MAKRIQWEGKKLIEADGGIGWERREEGTYQAELFGVTYELKKRRRSKAEPGDTGWYLYSSGSFDHGFSGDYASRTLMVAVDEATTMILQLDLRGPGFEPVR
ncbi:hypothetical protein [Streptomyces sp. NPDC018584]|uniref:hypothetical protein n=1 Tax=unclassified Streptomyces TaxID=2593676 RepID=UPI00378EB0A2